MFTLSPSTPTAISCLFLFREPFKLYTVAGCTRPFSWSSGFGRVVIVYGSSIDMLAMLYTRDVKLKVVKQLFRVKLAKLLGCLNVSDHIATKPNSGGKTRASKRVLAS